MQVNFHCSLHVCINAIALVALKSQKKSAKLEMGRSASMPRGFVLFFF